MRASRTYGSVRGAPSNGRSYRDSTLSANVRYSFLEQQSPIAVYSLFQNMLILGISKTF
jgi:hypothetical protein